VAPSPIVPASVAGGEVAAVKVLKRSPLARVEEEEVALKDGSYVAEGRVGGQSKGVAEWTGAEEKESSFVAEARLVGGAGALSLGWEGESPLTY